VVKNIVEKAKEEGTELPERRLQYYEKYGKQAETAEKFFADYGIEGLSKIRRAALQFVLSNKNVHTIPTAIANMDDINMHLGVSGTTLDSISSSDLNTFNYVAGFLNCRIGCDVCESKCPHKMPVNTILRYNYYYMAKKNEKDAMKLYSDLPGKKPDVCLDCDGYCEDACPYGVMTRALLTMAHKNLSFGDSFYG
jgi:predicted aldo/keto reductase-like oxidoreductase